MEDFLRSLYQNGYDDGNKDAEGLTDGQMKDVILTVKGIGEKKAEAIIEAMKNAMGKEEGGDGKESVSGSAEFHG
ncbi:MAG: hypothetical protein IJU50_04685 [Lachnospiraceae bacterium]|nr:hypothetical protein [Lachnospiraceae bacterium]